MVQRVRTGLNTIIQDQADSIVLSSIIHLLNQTCFIAPCGILWRCQGPVMLIYTLAAFSKHQRKAIQKNDGLREQPTVGERLVEICYLIHWLNDKACLLQNVSVQCILWQYGPQPSQLF